jgi:hypothetical protein
MDQISAGSEQGQWRSLVNMAVFSSLSSMVEPLPIKMLTGQEAKETAGNARRLLQYCQFSDRNPRIILRDIWNF